MRINRVFFAALAALLTSPAGASDLERERRMAVEVKAGLFTGEPLQLDADGTPFLAIFTASEAPQARGGVVILHGRGFHPDWPQVAGPLRSGLAVKGWHSLSLQMPVLATDAKYFDYVPVFPEAFPRIEAGIRFMKDKGIKPIILIAHSCGVHMAMAWIRARGEPGIDGFAGIGMGATDYQQKMAEPLPLASMRVPVLDLYGADDYPAVLRMAPQRLAAIRKAANPRSRQQRVPAADHYFTDRGDVLVETVNAWLATLAVE
ncbi:MAG: alpha/beta hydrolase family protein [Gammaproteobacteria bacterium]|jgi:pimeloyl-ACP methyl ester carboxylesterase|nr:alpha/beta hydrolase family protein [Gammaproteobacteria bacterium]